MEHITLYRKWRPKTFDEVKGRDEIITILKNQIKNNKLGHAYLFSGTRGTGKTSIAKIFAKAINCLNSNDGEPCGICDACKAYSSSIDIVEIDAASNNGVDNIRDIISDTEYLPSVSKYKVYIIDEVHMLSQGAFNALLKTLEEPPSHVVFILATTELNKLPVTIISRCQRFDFKPIGYEIISKQVIYVSENEGYNIQESAANYIAVLADGSFRDSLSILDMVMAYSESKDILLDDVKKILNRDDFEIYHSILSELYSNDIVKVTSDLDKILSRGKTIENFVLEFADYIKNVLTVIIAKQTLRDLTNDELSLVITDADTFSEHRLFFMLNELTHLTESIKKVDNKRLYLELSLFKFVVPDLNNDFTSVSARIESLEKQIEKLKTQKIIIQSDELKNDSIESDKNDSIEENKYVVKDSNNIPTDIKNIASKWRNIKWEKIGMSFMNISDKYSINFENNNLLILCHSQFMYNYLIGKYKLLEELIEKEMGINIPIEVRNVAVKNKAAIDLTEINFDIEKE